LSTSLILPDEGEDFEDDKDNQVLADSYEVEQLVGNLVDMIIDAGELSTQWTTILDLTDIEPEVLRTGQGEFS
jgi:tRNA A37 threonylcarbamoyladenosine synthetase subunit TsaC/SUA5/YrdC